MFTDQRSKKVLLVAHCILNQNSKIDRCAHYPGAAKEIVQALIESGVGLIQMPCPELIYLGLDRQVEPEALTTVESEDDRVALRMAEGPAREVCQGMAETLVFQLEEYHKHGFKIMGVLGINGSPTCGVEGNWAEGLEAPGPGVFIRVLTETCCARGLNLPTRGVKVYQPEQAIKAIHDLIEL
jgi:predicted secreted protein